MAADIHPPMLTDVISNPAYHSMEPFWQQWGVTHADLNNVLNTWIVMIVLIVAAILVKNKLEMVPKGVSELLGGGGVNPWRTLWSRPWENTAGRTFRLIASLALFILSCNLIGIIPWFQSSTNNLNTTLALALVSFVTTHYVGIKESRREVRQALYRAGTLAHSSDAAHRADRPL